MKSSRYAAGKATKSTLDSWEWKQDPNECGLFLPDCPKKAMDVFLHGHGKLHLPDYLVLGVCFLVLKDC
jgi:hypothetical protein